MNYKEISKRIAQETPGYTSGAQIISDVVEALQKQGLLPERLKEMVSIDNPSIIEREKEIKKFSPEARQFLVKEGYLIYPLTGKSIRLLMKEGRKFDLSGSLEESKKIAAQISRLSEVAINPEKLFLPKTEDKSIIEQFTMTEVFSRELGKKIRGIKAIVGEVADYAELVFCHLDKTGENLFGLNYNFCSTPTTSRVTQAGEMSHFKYSLLCIGNFREVSGLRIFDVDPSQKGPKAVPLLVPEARFDK